MLKKLSALRPHLLPLLSTRAASSILPANSLVTGLMTQSNQPFIDYSAPIHPAIDHVNVLFCGHDMENGFFFTKEEADRTFPSHVSVSRVRREEVVPGAAAVRDAHVIVPLMCRVDRSIIEAATNLRLIIQYGVGVEGVEMPAATERGVVVCNIPSAKTANARSCAEHAMYLTMGLLRDQHEMARSVRERLLGRPTGIMLGGRTVLVLGFGGIAQALLPRLKAFEVDTICVRRRTWSREDQESPAGLCADTVGTLEDLPRLLPRADIVVVTCPQTEENKGFVNREFLKYCKDGVRIVNVARGGLLDYDSCRNGLASGKIGGLGLDVHWSEPFDPSDPIATHPKVILTPHIAGVTDVSYRDMARVVAAESERARRGLLPSPPPGGSSVFLNTGVMEKLRRAW